MRVLAPFLLLCLAVLPARAGETIAPGDAAAVQSVIRQQLDAFNRDDGVAAFGFASPGIRAKFHSVETFMAMVRQAYAPVYHSVSAHFGALRVEGDRLVQEVVVTGRDGVTALASYLMVREPGGGWKIDGCRLEPLDNLGV